MSPSAPAPVRVTLATAADRVGFRELARATATTVELDAELQRSFARLWLGWVPELAPPVGLLLNWVAADELHVLDLCTRRDQQRRGIARALLRTALDHGVHCRCRLALLEVRASNHPAISLYQSAGFTVHNRRAGYYADGEDALEMSLYLPPPTPAPGSES